LGAKLSQRSSLRANVETEREGLDITEHTERAYNM
jgi:Amt family ammonium transporter